MTCLTISLFDWRLSYTVTANGKCNELKGF